jgi:hypothetical protein
MRLISLKLEWDFAQSEIVLSGAIFKAFRKAFLNYQKCFFIARIFEARGRPFTPYPCPKVLCSACLKKFSSKQSNTAVPSPSPLFVIVLLNRVMVL